MTQRKGDDRDGIFQVKDKKEKKKKAIPGKRRPQKPEGKGPVGFSSLSLLVASAVVSPL